MAPNYITILLLSVLLHLTFQANPVLYQPINDILITSDDYIYLDLDQHFLGDNLTYELNTTQNSNLLGLDQRSSVLGNGTWSSYASWTASEMEYTQSGEWTGRVAYIGNSNSFYLYQTDDVSIPPSYVFSFKFGSGISCYDIMFMQSDLAYCSCVEVSKYTALIILVNLTSQETSYVSAPFVEVKTVFVYTNYYMRRDAYGPLSNLLFLYVQYTRQFDYSNLGFVEIWNIADPLNPVRLQNLLDYITIGVSPLNIMDLKVVNSEIFIADAKAMNVYRVGIEPAFGNAKYVYTNQIALPFTAFNIYIDYYERQTLTTLMIGNNEYIAEMDWTDPKNPVLVNYYQQANSTNYLDGIIFSQEFLYLSFSPKESSNFLSMYIILQRDNVVDIYNIFNTNTAYQKEGGYLLVDLVNNILFYGNGPSYQLNQVYDAHVFIQNPVLTSIDATISASSNNIIVSDSFSVEVRNTSDNSITLLGEIVAEGQLQALSGGNIQFTINTNNIAGNNIGFSFQDPSLSMKYINETTGKLAINLANVLSSTEVIINATLQESPISKTLYYYFIATTDSQTQLNSIYVYKCTLKEYDSSMDCNYQNVQISYNNTLLNLVLMDGLFGILTYDQSLQYVYAFYSLTSGKLLTTLESTNPIQQVSQCTYFEPTNSSTAIDNLIACSYPYAKQVIIYAYNAESVAFDKIFVITEQTLGLDYFSPQGVLTSNYYSGIIFIKHIDALLTVKIDLVNLKSIVILTISSRATSVDPYYEPVIYENAILIVSTFLNSVDEYNTLSIQQTYLSSSYPLDQFNVKISGYNYFGSSNNHFYNALPGTSTVNLFSVGRTSVNDFVANIGTGSGSILCSVFSTKENDILIFINRQTFSVSTQAIYNNPIITYQTPTVDDAYVYQSVNISIYEIGNQSNTYTYQLSVLVYNSYIQIKPTTSNLQINIQNATSIPISSLHAFDYSSVIKYGVIASNMTEVSNGMISVTNLITPNASMPTLLNNEDPESKINNLYYDIGSEKLFSQGAGRLYVYALNKANNETANGLLYVIDMLMEECTTVTYQPELKISVSACKNYGITYLVFISYNTMTPTFFANFTTSLNDVVKLTMTNEYIFILNKKNDVNTVWIYYLDMISEELELVEQLNSGTFQTPVDIADYSCVYKNEENLYNLFVLDSGFGLRTIYASFNGSIVNLINMDTFEFYNSSSSDYLGLTESVALNSIDCAIYENDYTYNCLVTTISYNHYNFIISYPPPTQKSINQNNVEATSSTVSHKIFINTTFIGYGTYNVLGRPTFSGTTFALYMTNPSYTSPDEIVVYPMYSQYQSYIGGGIQANNTYVVSETASPFVLTPLQNGQVGLYVASTKNNNTINGFCLNEPTLHISDKTTSTNVTLIASNDFSSSYVVLLFGESETEKISGLWLALILFGTLIIIVVIGFFLEYTFAKKSKKTEDISYEKKEETTQNVIQEGNTQDEESGEKISLQQKLLAKKEEIAERIEENQRKSETLE